MKYRWAVLAITIAVLCVLNGFAAAQILPPPSLTLPLPILSTATVDPILRQILQTASFGQVIEAVLTLDHDPTPTDLRAVTATRGDGARFNGSPMIWDR